MLTTWWDTLYESSDEPTIPGYDPGGAEKNCPCTFKALTRHDVKQIMYNHIKVETYSPLMKKMLEDFVWDENAPKFRFVHQNCGSCQTEQSATITYISRIEKIFRTHLTSTTDAPEEGAMTKAPFNCPSRVSI
jgi:hypothetical protein